jgi:integrase
MTSLLLVDHPEHSFNFDLGTDEEHTLDHHDCPACKTVNVALQAENVNISTLPFSQAAKFWMLRRRQSPKLRPRTHDTTQGYLDALEKFFGRLILREITPGHLRSYQIARLNNAIRANGQELHPWKHRAGNSIVNHEISVLGQMLKHCRLWQRLRPFYFPRPMPKWSPREILSEEEEERFFRDGAMHPEAQVAYWVATITNNTTAAGCELRGLRLENIFLRDADDISEIYIPADAVKNMSRPRKIALNPTARWAVAQCYKRALKLGSCEPGHYLFPFRTKRNNWDPARPPSRWFLRNSWSKLVKATGKKDLRPHDLRHNCITRLLENDVDPETIRAIAGHVNPKMMEYYAHQRRRVKYAAVLAIEPKPLPPKKPPVAEGVPGQRGLPTLAVRR